MWNLRLDFLLSAITGKARNDIVQPLGSPPGSIGVNNLPPGTMSPLGPSMGPVHPGQVGGPHPPLPASPSPTNNNIINFNNKQPSSGEFCFSTPHQRDETGRTLKS